MWLKFHRKWLAHRLAMRRHLHPNRDQALVLTFSHDGIMARAEDALLSGIKLTNIP